MRLSVRGFGLVELMVAMLLGLTLVLALVQYLSSSRDSWLLQQQSASQQEDARYLLGRLARDLRAAGGYGCLDLERALPEGLPPELAQSVRFDAGVLSLVTAVPAQRSSSQPQTLRAADFGARWLLAGDCQRRVAVAEREALTVLPGDWVVPLRQLEYRQQGDRVQVRLNGAGNYETLIEQVVRFVPSFGLAADAQSPGVAGHYQSDLGAADQARLRSVRLQLVLGAGMGTAAAGRTRDLVFRQVTRLRNRPDGRRHD